ncbi:transcriptional regulator [Sphingopyxis lindanitolerans]|uniref:Transcriptional regulator n=1 Tax=Sphingopyxis lindanitolerans TaxID=2054227 RepID=A0A2S8B3X4_9SPHN|nr:cupin-like domain-containing protein [Sphingopyxis lindanitolerans]PQM27050.1 transcriptional regulator [Sphingopyxis lindanitolerans]
MVGPIFSSDAHAAFNAAYPGVPTHLTHQIAGHPLLELGALLELAGRLRPESLEHNAAVDLPLGIRNADIPANGLSVADTIARIDECGSWVLLKTVDQDAAYAALMREVLAEIEPVVEPRTGAMMRLEGFIFISSPRAVTPLHFDPEYNILFQARGSKTMTLFPPADPDIIGQPFFEQYFAGGPRNLPWRDEWAARGRAIDISPGEAIYVPILAPHWVQTHDDVSVSLSLTWRSEWSFHHADACRFNRRLRARGLNPAAPRLYPQNNRLKSYAQRALARIEARGG